MEVIPPPAAWAFPCWFTFSEMVATKQLSIVSVQVVTSVKRQWIEALWKPEQRREYSLAGPIQESHPYSAAARLAKNLR